MGLVSLSSSNKTKLVLIFSFFFNVFIHSNALVSLGPTFITRECLTSTDDSDLFLQGDSRSSLMSDLILHASNYSFYSSQSTTGNNTSYGLFYCTADVKPEDCAACVKSASLFCMYRKAGFVFYEECTLRYGSVPVYAVVDYESVTAWYYGLTPVSYSQFNTTLYSTLNGIIPEAANGTTRVAKGEADLAGTSQKLYTLAQCTPDILGSECEKCLQVALEKMPLCDNSTCSNPMRKSIDTFLPSCQLRYEVRYPSSVGSIQASSSSPLGLGGKYIVCWYIMMMALAVTMFALH